MKKSNSKKIRKEHAQRFFKMYCGYITFACVFSVLALLVFEFLPADAPINNEYAIKNLVSKESDGVSRETQTTMDYHTQVVSHKNKKDAGLELYRNPDSRQSVIWFYDQITGNTEVTKAILENADSYDIPLSLAFALAYTESNYVVKAYNANTNKSIDRGLFQLNNKTFPSLTIDEFYDPYTNAKFGLSHLKFCLNTAGNEVSALAMYNAGTMKVKSGKTPEVTLKYVSNIMNYRNGLDMLFNSQVAVFYISNTNTLLAKASR